MDLRPPYSGTHGLMSAAVVLMPGGHHHRAYHEYVVRSIPRVPSTRRVVWFHVPVRGPPQKHGHTVPFAQIGRTVQTRSGPMNERTSRTPSWANPLSFVASSSHTHRRGKEVTFTRPSGLGLVMRLASIPIRLVHGTNQRNTLACGGRVQNIKCIECGGGE